VWTGAGDGLYWSNPLNWSGSAPTAAESSVTLDFPADAQPLAVYNDISGLTVQSVTFEGAYTINGGGVTLAGSIATGGFAVEWTVPISLSADATLGGGTTQAPSPTSFMITGPIGGIGNVTIAAGSAVTFASSANNTYSGATLVDGTLTLDSSAPGSFTQVGPSFQPGGSAIPQNLTIDAGGTVNTQTRSYQLATQGDVTVNAGGTLHLGGTTDLVRSAEGDGTVSGDGTLVLFGGGNFTGPIDGTVSVLVGAGASSVFGPGVGLTSGTIAQISGTLFLNDAQLPNAQVSDNFDYNTFSMPLYRGLVGRVTGGGTIGSLFSHAQFVQPGGPGLAPLTVLGDVTFQSYSTFQLDTRFGTQSIIAYGTVTLGGATFSLSDTVGSGDPRPARGTVYTLIDNRGAGPIAGTFNNLPNGSLITSGSNAWRLNYNGGDGNDVTLTYLGRDTSVTVSSDANPAVFGHTVLHAAVTLNIGTPDAPLTGTVTFFADGMPIGSALLDQNATATLDAVTLSPGLHSITAAYSGDVNEYESSTSPGKLPQRVTQSTPTVTLTAPADATGTISVLVQQTDAQGVMPGGQVTLDVDGSPTVSVALDGSGGASFNMPVLPAGAHVLTATYAGDSDFVAAATAAPTTITMVPQITVTSAMSTVPASGTDNLLFPVTLSAPSAAPITVNYTTQDASAQAGHDYVAESGTLTFAPGQTNLTVAVPLIGRANWLPDLTLSLVLSSATGATLSSSTATGTIQSTDGVPAAGLVPDESDPSRTDLVVDGTVGNDVILVRPTKLAGQVQVVVNNVIVATDSGLARVIVYGGAGNDRITADPKLAIGVVFFGGDGNDTLTGGAANDILVGGNGVDTLVGGNGMNLLIGGDGADRLKGSRLGDILVGGATPYDSGRLSDLRKLQSVLGVWTSGAAYDARVTEISSAMPSGWNLNGALTIDSSLRDSFGGANTRNWIIRTLTAQARLQHAVRHPRGG
jgi:Ca2+-binding RTX toxin-like protein